ncbi:hypothetical protein [Mycobacteroides abscessus]|uniref:hypothetical protein n=1 Tax=Mycobacteroides abscessus TaxID=36809 RepID=UPI0009268B0C|nr:hypothetical protein [Mycobacteroides abscessus]MBN7371108.1 hypothetical protein [Mycobacteroides abscessus subsp. abscessus]MBN7522617.1 hypothetical protein [Mycobacteroides abscessus subsp. abscessus]MDB2185156.1 hypothetical protein [Mycobacteroides abscessus subsp. abscessus]MDO3123491.1 hypothetical protein [Mycobacteroides abscessus subsp. abscessus]MDO3173302.1 hypothetical protein [Mycobacteroides abscessus subsp. abscessus]
MSTADDAHEMAAEAVYRAGIELASDAVSSTAHALLIGAAAEARHRGIPVVEVIAGRAELTMAVAEVQRRHLAEGTPDAEMMASRVSDQDVWSCVQLRARNILIMRLIEADQFAFPQGGAA